MIEVLEAGPLTTVQDLGRPGLAHLGVGRSGAADRGILFCATGHGMCIVANKFCGVRAVPCHDDLTAEMSRRHNDANVLCLSADLLGERLVTRMVELWLTTEFEGGRHARRLEKIALFEAQNGCPPRLPRTGTEHSTGPQQNP